MKLDELPLYRVSYCTVDPYYDKVFCYISRNAETKGLECHAFLCTKKSKAEAITLTVAQAFNIAFERWQASKKRAAQKAPSTGIDIGDRATATTASKAADTPNGTSGAARKTTPPIQVATPTLAPPPSNSKRVTPSPPPPNTNNDPVLNIDVTAPTNPPPPVVYHVPVERRSSRDDSHLNIGPLAVKSTIAKAVSLDYLQLEDNFDMEFTRLAEARSNPRLPIGDHIRSSRFEDDVAGFLQGERSSKDVMQTRSVDDLLDL
ncbi:Low density lipoprotein receptor adapter protein 1 [Geodia barretti]|nr:Low density lipoprotein receptor adapter protein 1 [Geodia barretti]